MTRFASIWREIATPSDARESAYLALLIAGAHALVGAALTAWLPAVGIAAVARLILPSVYVWIKERRDMARGGGWRDSMVDAVFVGLGGFYDGAPWWPVAVLIAALIAASAFGPSPDASPTHEARK